jgi:hypothetical protein
MLVGGADGAVRMARRGADIWHTRIIILRCKPAFFSLSGTIDRPQNLHG